MSDPTIRDNETVAAGLAAWWTAHHPIARNVEVIEVRRPAAGRSNETVLATVVCNGESHPVALRLPTVQPSFPTYDLGAQAAVQTALQANGIPAARPIAFEADESWLGAPFLVMTAEPGRSFGDAPALDSWLAGAGEAVQRRVHDGFATLLAAVHHLDWRQAGLHKVLRGSHGGLAAEVRWWLDYLNWAADGNPHPRLQSLAQWCEANVPTSEPPLSLCWGDARVGNVLYDDHGDVTAALDWELATIGPAEMDVAWWFALDDLLSNLIGRTVPGFPNNETAQQNYEARLGRPLQDLGWHKIFVTLRTAAVTDRQARTAAALGATYRGVNVDNNPVLAYGEQLIDQCDNW